MKYSLRTPWSQSSSTVKFRNSVSSRNSVSRRHTNLDEFSNSALKNLVFGNDEAGDRIFKRGMTALVMSSENELIEVSLKIRFFEREIRAKFIGGGEKYCKKQAVILAENIAKIRQDPADILDVEHPFGETAELNSCLCIVMEDCSLLSVKFLSETDKAYFVHVLRVILKQ